LKLPNGTCLECPSLMLPSDQPNLGPAEPDLRRVSFLLGRPP
jgi:hypothetical protein